MTYGLQVTNASGVVTFDSRFAAGGVLAAIIEHPGGGSTVTQTYPAFAGSTVDWLLLSAADRPPSGVVIDYALGYPRVAVTSSTPSSVGVFAQ